MSIPLPAGSPGSLPPEVLPDVLERLGTSLAAALPACRGVAAAAVAGDAAAFRPLSFCRTSPSPASDGQLERGRCGRVARARRPGTSWSEAAQVVCNPEVCRASWSEQAVAGCTPSHRHSIALCGASGHEEKALLFGGNVSRSVAGSWRTSDELFLAKLPGAAGEPVSLASIPRASTASWPCSRWGASLTQTLGGVAVLWGGWSRDGETAKPWTLRLREAEADWTEVPLEGPSAVAFHTATALPDGKRVAVVGGLGDGGSRSGVWMFDSSSEEWTQACEDGPSSAGASAAVEVDSQRLVVCLGVQRDRFRFGDSFLTSASVFDLRMQRWDQNAWSRSCESDREQLLQPTARRNAATAALGHRLIIAGGHSDASGGTVGDTWLLNMRSGSWSQLPAASPELEGHKAVLSGLDMFTFGGHSSPGTYPRRGISAHMLTLGQGESLPGPMLDSEQSEEGSDTDSDDDGPGTIPVQLLLRLLAAQRRAAATDGPSGGYAAEDT
eukprot:TRINITY_DN32451_c0_g1_i2.p1 TRINITY_DN32451_c0_g1~~TRINITY_DN32451_c0_g1_i2.p1  ORF type:complete len:513 (-),score=96.42 TRINITY_DN32451_c0_g1_i2:9-1502(-)